MSNPRLSKLEWRFVIGASVFAVFAVAYLGYRLAMGAHLDPGSAPFPVLRSTAVIAVPGGHAYQYIAAPDLTWAAARDAAAKLSWHGHAGYLATIDDAAEFRLVTDTIFNKIYPDVTYLGGRQTAPGEWRWVTGPDAAEDGGKGKLFWTGFENGSAAPGAYADWMSTAFNHGGKWDVTQVCCVTLFSYRRPQLSTSLGNAEGEEAVAGYLVEFGG